jgi:hypothetical protein
MVPVDETDLVGRGRRDDAEKLVGRRTLLTPPLDAPTIRRVRLVSVPRRFASWCDDAQRWI